MQIEVLGERYQLQDPIGRGGMATIYRGRDMRMERTVAIKVLREVYSTDPKFVTRFQREAKAASSLQHPNIVQVFDYGQSDGNYFIVMELVEGTDLRRYLRSRGVLAIDRAIIIAHDVALGLGAAHRRSIVHRDVKPQNILVGRDGSIKLTDFGIASVYKDINAERLTTTGMTLGTVQYYAPEQAQGEIVSPAADVYALGIVMYEMLTGRTPFDGDTPVAVAMQHIQDMPAPPSQINPNIPPALEEIILRCLEKIPEMRYRDGNVLARALERLGEDDGRGGIPAYLPPSGMANSSMTNVPTINPNGAALSGGMQPEGQPGANNQTIGPLSYNQNGVINGQENGAATALRSDQPFPPVDPSGATTVMEPRPVPYSSMGNVSSTSDATRPFNRNEISATGGQDRRESRMASIITVLILLATLILLAFSIYLAGQLGFLPFSNSNNATPTATIQQVAVPDLRGKTYTQAKEAAKKAGFNLVVDGDSHNGTVKDQSPRFGDRAAQGSDIHVVFAQGKKVPTDLVGKSLSDVEAELKSDNIQYTIAADPQKPQDSTQAANTVTGTNPAGGQSISSDQVITVYVTNWQNPSISPTTGPTQAPQPTTAPTPTTAPQPTPTTAPQPTPTTAPQPTPTTAPKPTPTV